MDSYDVSKYVKSLSPVASKLTNTSWTFLTNHTHVLLCLATDPERRLRDVAVVVGITERATQRIVADLESAGALVRTRDGRRNRYEVNMDLPLRHPLESTHTIGDLIRAVAPVPVLALE